MKRTTALARPTAAKSALKIANASSVRSLHIKNTSSYRPTPFLTFQRYASVSVKVPDMAESITEGTLAAFNKEVGDFVSQDETIATIETDKIDVEVNAPVSGTITEFLVDVDATVEVGQEIIKMEEGDAPAGGASASEAPAKKEEAPEKAKEESAPAAAPKKEETKKEEPKKESKPAPKKEESKKATQSTTSAPTFTNFSRNEERVKMNRMRLRIAERLKESQNTAASLTTFNEVDMSNLMDFRKKYKDEFIEKTGIKLGFMGAFSKASALALKEIPAVNAAIENNDTLVFKDYADISIAVATPKGLVTPVVRNAESLSILGIEKEISNLGKKARDGKLTLEDMTRWYFHYF